MMIEKEWIERAADLERQHLRYHEADVISCRAALLGIYKLFKAAPTPIVHLYSVLPEALIASAAKLRVDAITSGDFGWSRRSSATDTRGWVLSIGAQARALDQVLISSAPAHRGPAKASEWYCEANQAYAIPRLRPRQAEGSREWHRFTRRGILHHRIVPSVLDAGFRVNVIPSSTAASPSNGDVTMGAAFLPELKLQLKEGNRQFIATGAACPDGAKTVGRQIEAAYTDNCSIVVWPELTIPPELRSHIQGTLKNRLLVADKRKSLQLVVAGSFHETDDLITHNVAHVLDGYGLPVASYKKVLPYHDDKLGLEGITPGDTVPVLVTSDHLISFGICKDFCDAGVRLAYDDLDVDLVLIPSMGRTAAMDGHRLTAKQVRVAFSTRAFVVQQADESKHLSGWVLPFPDDPVAGPLEKLWQKEDWKSFTGSLHKA